MGIDGLFPDQGWEPAGLFGRSTETQFAKGILKSDVATYKEIQGYIRVRHGTVVQTCWIADVKEQLGLPMRLAPNRQSAIRVKPCPPDKKVLIVEAMKTLGTDTLKRQIRLNVPGLPPAKSEALSILGERHAHRERVQILLQEASNVLAASDGVGLGASEIGIELTIRCPNKNPKSDATNYLGGVGDALENKARRGSLEHLGDLARVHLYENDSQIKEVHYRVEEASEASYELLLWSLGN